MSSHPVAVLGGWLGCRPRALRRYVELYRSLGVEVICHIPTPRMVVDYTLQRRPTEVPKQWPILSPVPHGGFESMQQLAWNVLAQIHNKQECALIYHGFSNGGCFLWEEIRRIMLDVENIELEQRHKDILKLLPQRLRGAVFDSGPAWFDGTSSSLRLALEHCTLSERVDIMMHFGPGVIYYDGKKETRQRNKRLHDYFSFFHEDPLDIPQLYLYSEDDKLCNFEQVDKLVFHRRSIQRQPVLRQNWKSSPHCDHLRTHTNDYTETVKAFTETCLMQSKL